MPHRYFIMMVAWVCLQTLPPVSCSLHLDVLEGVWLQPALHCVSDSFHFHASCKHSPPQRVLTPSFQLLSLELSFCFSHMWEQTRLAPTSEHIPNITALPSPWPMCVPSQPRRPRSCPSKLDPVSLFPTRDINITTSLFYSEALTSIPSESKRQPSHIGVWPDCLPFLPHCFPRAVFP